MGGFFNKAATAGGTALGGPVGGGLAFFGANALTGGDIGSSISGGLTAGVSELAPISAVSSAKPNFGKTFMSSMGFGKDPTQNIFNGLGLVNSLRNTTPFNSESVLPPEPASLLDTLRARRGY